MPRLKNAKHELFAQGMAKGMKQAEAYAAAGFKPNPQAASNLCKKVNILDRVAEIQSKAAKRAEVSAQDVLDGLHKEATREGEGTTHGARVQAWGLLGKYHKLFIDRIEAEVTHKFSSLSDDELDQEINRLAGKGR